MVDIICFLSKKENLYCPGKALNSPLTVLLLPFPGVRHVEPSSSLLDVIELILEGAQNLVVPILSNCNRKTMQKTSNNGHEFCRLTQEYVIRFLLSSIGLFPSIAASNIESLGLISLDFMAVSYDSPASPAIESISHSLAKQTSLGVVDDNGILVGEISPFTLAWCDESVAAAIATLSTGELLAYIDCGGPPKDIVRVVKARLKQKNLEGMLGEFEFQYSNISSSNSSTSLKSLSSEEDFSPSPPSLTTTVGRHGKYNRSRSSKMGRAETIVCCHSDNSLVAVMTHAITCRVNYVWVIDDDYRLVGIVTFSKILEVFKNLCTRPCS